MGLLDIFTKTYKTWILDLGGHKQEGLTLDNLKDGLFAIGQGDLDFLTLKPNEPKDLGNTKGDSCQFMQACLDQEGQFHLELCLINPKVEGYIIYAKDGLSLEGVNAMMVQFLKEKEIPNYKDWYIGLDTRPKATDVFLGLANILTNDIDLKTKLKVCAYNPFQYFLEHKDMFEDIGLESSDSIPIMWQGFAHELEVAGLAVYMDWKTELEDFLWLLQPLADRQGLSLEQSWFQDSDSIPIWAQAIDEKWNQEGYCLGTMDLDADGYLLVIMKKEALEEAGNLAAKFGLSFMKAAQA